MSAGRRRLSLALAGTVLAPVVAYLVVRTAAIGLNPATGAVLPPRNPSALLGPVAQAAAMPDARVDERMRELAQAGLRAEPLSYEPFFIEARAQEQRGRLDAATRLMEEVKRRRASFLPARLFLGTYYGQARRSGALLNEIDYVLRASPQALQLALPEIVKLMRVQDGREALASMLVQEPGWSEDFYRVAAQQNLPPETTLSLYQLVRSQGGTGATLARAQRLHLLALVGSNQFGLARRLALAGLSEQDRSRHTPVFDREFRGIDGPRPFAWELSDTGTGRAETVIEGGRPRLDIHYFGGSNMILAEQMLALEPGSYQLRFLAKSDTAEAAQSLYWSISCLPGDRQVARMPLAGLAADYRPLRAGFSVPASGCGGQRLRLLAEAGEMATTVNAQVADLEIARAD